MPARRSAGSDTIALTVNEITETRDALDDHHEHERQEQRDHGNGGERRRETELEEAEDLHRDRYLARSYEKKREVHIRKRMHESEYGARDDAALDQGEHDVNQRAPPRCPETRGRELDVRRQRMQADRHRAHRERQTDHHVPDKERGESDEFAQTDVLEKLE